ncbi:MAG: TlpA family protein disulfide reductase [Flavobacteriales bacterium]|nr:TlpA family protein disulfide reductase [Flavobacteriales bacterium]
MKKLSILLIAAGLFATLSFVNDGGIDTGKKMPTVMIKDMEGHDINTAEVSNDGNPIVISFWATWCKPCRLELNTIMDDYDDLVEETGVKLVAVSIDDERNKHKVEPTVNAAGWDYDIWLDPNGDLKRALGVNNVPQTFLLNGEGSIVWTHSGFSPGDEEELYDEIRKISK